ncbi:MAG: c-type cytochrome [Planctomycetota bacterium]
MVRTQLPVFLAPLLVAATLGSSLSAQHGQGDGSDPKPQTAPGLQNDPAAAQALLDTFKVPEGFGLKLVASEPHLENPVAFDIGPDGRFYVVETHRLRAGVIDMRDHRAWVHEDLANRTVEQRVESIERHFAESLPDWLTEYEIVKTLTDSDGDGVVDDSVVLERDAFGGYASGVAAGVLRVGDSIYTTNIPGLFRSIDSDGDGIAERTETLHDGFGVHFSLIGHDMHGLIVGPDRRLYFSIGDRGFSVTRPDGVVLDFPDEGAVLRCELDGSNLEVIHRGLRNPQELAFDDYGNLFTGDNNSDSVDRARLVLVQPGADSGWRIGFQWLNDRGEWVQEGLWQEQHAGQPAFVSPPLKNVGHGPSGIAIDPGGTLPPEFAGRLFWCDFRGNARASKILAIAMEPKGAGFDVTDVKPFLENTLATDLCFDADGSIVVSDWVRGWGKTGKGRLHRVTAPTSATQSRWDNTRFAAERLIPEGVEQFSSKQLAALLDHEDRRVRMAAQFRLVDLGATSILVNEANTEGSLLRRLHAVWGLGLRARAGDSKATSALRAMLETSDDRPAILRGQVARMLGDAFDREAVTALCGCLNEADAGLQREVLTALAMLRDSRALSAVGQMILRTSNDGTMDPWLRVAAAFAMARCDDGRSVEHDQLLLSEQNNGSAEIRLACVLALRHRRSVGVAAYLSDIDPNVAAAAARAIHGQRIEEAAPFLAARLADPQCDNEPVLWRAIEACRRLGGRDHFESLCDFVRRESAPESMRRRAIRAIAEFLDPHPQDTVDGLIRRFTTRSRLVTHGLLARHAKGMIDSLPAELAREVVALCEDYDLDSGVAIFTQTAIDQELSAIVRARAVEALARAESLSGEVAEAIASGIPADAEAPLPRAIVFLLSRKGSGPGEQRLGSLCRSERLEDQRFALEQLSAMGTPAAQALLADLVSEMPPLSDVLKNAEEAIAVRQAAARAAAEAAENGEPAAETPDPLVATAPDPTTLPNLEAIHEDVLIAAKSAGGRAASAVDSRLSPAELDENQLIQFAPLLAGGSARAGRTVFETHPTAQCIRCHTVNGQAGGAGPTLKGVASRQHEIRLLESMVDPSARLADGFAVVLIETSDGDPLQGTVLREDDDNVVLRIGEEERTIARSAIKSRTPAPSTMPNMRPLLTRQELRDLVAYLRTL